MYHIISVEIVIPSKVTLNFLCPCRKLLDIILSWFWIFFIAIHSQSQWMRIHTSESRDSRIVLFVHILLHTCCKDPQIILYKCSEAAILVIV